MRVEAVAPSADAHQFLPGSQFVDAFSVLTKNTQMTAKEAAERIFNQRPPWVGRLMSVRDMVVSPFGLKTSRMASNVADRVGIFPVISETPERAARQSR